MILFFKQFEIVFLERSHDVLSMIFGIFGKFGIEIGAQKFLGRKKFVEKNIEKVCRNFFGRKKK